MTTNAIARLFQATPIWVFLFLAVVCALSAFFLRHFLRARQFRRMSVAGVQMFKSYTSMYITQVWEQLAWMLSKILTVTAVVLALVAAAKLLS
jgi:uncharacterized membrane protein